MVIKLLPSQIPVFWETIKFVAVTADEVDEKDIKSYLNILLHQLLSGKAQCFVRLDNDRRLLALIITKFIFNRVNSERSLFINCMYSFQVVDDKLWKQDIQFIYDFAKRNGCKTVSFESRNKRIFEIAELIGCRELNRTFVYEIV